MKNDGIPRLNK